MAASSKPFIPPSVTQSARGSHLLGQSGDFAGFRSYQPGDDPRLIDWRATARTRHAIVRQRERESDRPLTIIIDVSASMWLPPAAPNTPRPIDSAFQAATFIAAAALLRQLAVEVMLVTDTIELHLKPMHGRESLRQIITALTQFQPKSRNTNWLDLLHMLHTRPARHLLFWLSDFNWLPDPQLFRNSLASHASWGLFLEPHTSARVSPNDIPIDIETGTQPGPNSLISSPRQRSRLSDWSTLATMPVIALKSNQPRPELKIASGLRFATPGHLH